jgi:hypothetical protein
VDDSWQESPLSFRQNCIPWVDVLVNMDGRDDVPMSVYIDLAAGDALAPLLRDGVKFARCPPCVRVASLGLGSFTLRDVFTAFTQAHVPSRREGADGVLGNDAAGVRVRPGDAEVAPSVLDHIGRAGVRRRARASLHTWT